jgi:hypothetical protein
MHTGHSTTAATDTTTSGTSTHETNTGETFAAVQIRRAEHEPAPDGVVPPVVACPQCGGPVSIATAADIEVQDNPRTASSTGSVRWQMRQRCGSRWPRCCG